MLSLVKLYLYAVRLGMGLWNVTSFRSRYWRRYLCVRKLLCYLRVKLSSVVEVMVINNANHPCVPRRRCSRPVGVDVTEDVKVGVEERASLPSSNAHDVIHRVISDFEESWKRLSRLEAECLCSTPVCVDCGENFTGGESDYKRRKVSERESRYAVMREQRLEMMECLHSHVLSRCKGLVMESEQRMLSCSDDMCGS